MSPPAASSAARFRLHCLPPPPRLVVALFLHYNFSRLLPHSPPSLCPVDYFILPRVLTSTALLSMSVTSNSPFASSLAIAPGLYMCHPQSGSLFSSNVMTGAVVSLPVPTITTCGCSDIPCFIGYPIGYRRCRVCWYPHCCCL